jgi:5-methylthioadenosine/S-adenosylhomocysteine deaminase
LTATEPGEGSPLKCDLLLSGGAVVTVDDDRRVLDPGVVAIEGNRILAVAAVDEMGPIEASRTVDCTGMAVLPGFTDCHTHLFQTLARGLGDGYALWPWLTEFMWPYATKINTSEVRVAATLGAIQAVRAGTTTIVDNHYGASDLETTLALASALDEVGVRASIARGIVGHPTVVSDRMKLTPELFLRSAEEELDIMRGCLEARPPNGRVNVWPAPLNVIYVDQELFIDSITLAREFGTGWHTHCSEGEIDPQMYLDAYGIRPVDWLYEEGLLGSDATLAHSIWLDDREIERIGETRSAVSYNPVSNEYIGCGVLPLRKLRAAGAVVGLGSDGAAVTGTNLLEVMKQAPLLQRAHTMDPTASYADEAIELATREGATYAGVDAGVLVPGNLADIAVIDLDRVHLRPLNRVVTAVVYHAVGSDVTMTIVDGRIVYEDGHCTFVDEVEVTLEAQRRSDELMRRAGMEAQRAPWLHRPEDSGAE